MNLSIELLEDMQYGGGVEDILQLNNGVFTQRSHKSSLESVDNFKGECKESHTTHNTTQSLEQCETINHFIRSFKLKK